MSEPLRHDASKGRWCPCDHCDYLYFEAKGDTAALQLIVHGNARRFQRSVGEVETALQTSQERVRELAKAVRER